MQGGPCLGPLTTPLKTGEAKIDDRASVHLPCASELLAGQFLAARPVWPCCSWDMAWRFSSVRLGLSKVGVPGLRRPPQSLRGFVSARLLASDLKRCHLS